MWHGARTYGSRASLLSVRGAGFLRNNSFIIPFSTAVPFWGQNYLEFELIIPKTGLQFQKG